MADALDPVGKVHEGFWLDWSRGKVWGHTLTLGPTSATLLTNVLAIWVTVCSVQLWTIFRFILHQKVASVQPEALTPHLNGQRIVLRNGGSALATAHLMLDLAWNNRRSTGRRSKRAYAIALLAITCALLFAASGAYSNKLISASLEDGDSRVLLRNDNCGVWNTTAYEIATALGFSTEEQSRILVQYKAHTAQEAQMSLQYAQDCYLSRTGTTDTRSTACHILKKPALSWELSNSTVCPYTAPFCHSGSETVRLDTGYIDSHEDLGINAAPAERLKYRRITTCTVLNSTSDEQGWDGAVVNASSPRPSATAARVFYGRNLIRKTDWTYSYSNFASFFDNYTAKVTSPYYIDIESALAPTDPQWSESDFSPVTGLAQETADLNLIFLSYTGTYLGAVHDPWFYASRQRQFDNSVSILADRYERDSAISTVACTEQHEFCTALNDCTGLLGFDQVQNVKQFNDLLSPHKNATFDRMLRAAQASRLAYVIPLLQQTTTPILASMQASDGRSGATISPVLPDDQWKSELEFWQSIAMAQLQRTVARWATGQIVPGSEYLLNATEPQDLWYCQNFIVLSGQFQSFTVAAIVLILILGTLVIVVGLYIKPIASRVQGYMRSTTKRHWDNDNIFELKRLKSRGRGSPRKFRKSNSRHAHVSVPASALTIDSPVWSPVRHHHDTTIPVLPRRMSTCPPRANYVADSIRSHTKECPQPLRSRTDSWMAISLDGSDVSASSVQPKMRYVPGANEKDKTTSQMPQSTLLPSSVRKNEYMHAAKHGARFF